MERVSPADTHPCIIIFPPRLLFHRCGWQPSRIFFSSLFFVISSFLAVASTLLLPLSPWKPCGSYATFGPGTRQAQRIPWRRRVRRVGGEGDPDGCERIRSRNVTWMQYLKAAQRQYSLLSTGALSRRLLRSIVEPSFEAEKREPPVILIWH